VKYIYLLITTILLAAAFSFGQTIDPAAVKGSVKGTVTDAAQNNALKSATVAIYRVSDSSLLTYSLCSKEGVFSFKNLPIEVSLKLIVSFTGYASFEKKLILTATAPDIDLAALKLMITIKELQEVLVTVPPVRMKGDTLEFNADAFKLDPNAQTEDLLRILPGIVIWGDGSITVNGREVKSVLVNGKPFFGADHRIATQNIPQSAVDKIQVYQKDNNLLKADKDSVTEMNIKLKKGKDKGYFGKITGGYGCSNLYDGTLIFNLFSGKTQLSIGLAANTVNKDLGSITQLLLNNTFTGPGVTANYKSNFNVVGINRFKAAGLSLNHDIGNKSAKKLQQQINTNIFFNEKNTDYRRTQQAITTTGNNNYFIANEDEKNTSFENGKSIDAGYSATGLENKLTIHTSGQSNAATAVKLTKSITGKNGVLLSSNENTSTGDDLTNKVKTDISYYHKKNRKTEKNSPAPYAVTYTVDVSERKSKGSILSDYTVFQNTAENRYFTRKYDNNSTSALHTLFTDISSPFHAFFKPKADDNDFSYSFKTLASVHVTKENNLVMDKSISSADYAINTYLTNRQQKTITDILPSFTFDKEIELKSQARKSSSLSLSLKMAQQFYYLQNLSQKAFQQFSNAYTKFLPEFNMAYSNKKQGFYRTYYSLRIGKSVQYPDVYQLAPLTDSINQNYIVKGNPLLKEQEGKFVSLFYNYTNEPRKNTFIVNLFASAGINRNYFASSNFIDTLGRNVYTVVNAGGHKTLSINADIKKAYKYRKYQWQIALVPGSSFQTVPQYINGMLYYFSNSSVNYTAGLYFTYDNRILLHVTHNGYLGYNKQKNTGLPPLKFRSGTSELSTSLKLNKKVTVGNDFLYIQNSFNGKKNSPFTLWNADISVRFFKDNTGEIKFSAMDILKKNKGVYTRGVNNTIANGNETRLQQYFLLSVAWFPRQFGKKNK
jgi:hypothetical protein